MERVEPCPTCAGRGVLPPEKVCANETCGRSFRWVDDAPSPNRHTAGVMYCCRRCAKAQAERTRRNRSTPTNGENRQAAERRVTAMKGVVTKTKKRIAKGKCVRCSCEFPDLAAHMTDAHPDYAPETT